MTPLLKKLLIALGIALVIFGAVFLSRQFGTDTSVSFDSTMPSEGGDVSTQSALVLANTQKINSLKIDQSFFTSQAFRSLVDNRVQLTPIPSGRENPFVSVQ